VNSNPTSGAGVLRVRKSVDIHIYILFLAIHQWPRLILFMKAHKLESEGTVPLEFAENILEYMPYTIDFV
jgi:hypothetical protein